jgi:hypothetical protein
VRPGQKQQIVRRPILEALQAIKDKGKQKEEVDYDKLFKKLQGVTEDVNNNLKSSQEDPFTMKLQLIHPVDDLREDGSEDGLSEENFDFEVGPLKSPVKHKLSLPFNASNTGRNAHRQHNSMKNDFSELTSKLNLSEEGLNSGDASSRKSKGRKKSVAALSSNRNAGSQLSSHGKAKGDQYRGKQVSSPTDTRADSQMRTTGA